MMKRNLFVGGGTVVLGLLLIALPSPTLNSQEPADRDIAQTEQRVSQASVTAAIEEAQEQQRRIEVRPEPGDEDGMVMLGDDGASWLGVESEEISAEKAKELKLPAERGVLLERVVPDSPAAKAGLKDNDVITEINGQRVEGAAQFHRMIHEIPAGRSAQFTVWRDGHAQTISVTLGKSEDRGNMWFKTAPRAFSFQLPRVEIPEMPDMPGMDWSNGGVLAGARPRLGIDAEDLSGQFGAYFGAPDGEGVLVRAVNTGSAAEKAGVKSGDVITSLNGERIRSLGDLREKLGGKREEKAVKLGVLRNKSEVSITVELPPPPSKTPRVISRRTNI
jgi:predicted metalloprotease with PDZ domain